MFENLEDILIKYEDLNAELASPDVTSDQNRFRKLMKEQSELTPLVEAYTAYKRANQDIEDSLMMLEEENDEEMRDMLKEELSNAKKTVAELEETIKILLLPKDPNDDKNVIVEIRAGAGGDEAALFAAELFRMYTHYAEARRWRVEVVNADETGIGGMKEVEFMVTGQGAYSVLKYESGVHRVQRVPETESGGRIHTSTASVAVMPEAEDVEVHIDEKDIRIDVMRASGNGGQCNPNLFVGGISTRDWNAINNDPNYPLNNKAINGEYPPGSTFKIVTGSAAFELNKVTLNELIYDGGYHPLVPTMGNAGGEVLGWLSFIKGLAMSDNVYFYELGYRVGIDAIAKYARIYGFGEPTGIDLEGESGGLVASKQVKLDIWNEGWRLGDTFNAAIGQGFNLSTPLQLAVMLSCVANGGIKHQPYLVDSFLNPDGSVAGKPERNESKHIDVSQRTIDYMRDGMSATTEAGGTASYFASLPRKVAGKTGTAENPHGRDHGLFVAYGPVEDPELVVVAIVEQGGYGSSSAGPIVYEAFEEYYRLKGWMPPEPTKEELEAMARVAAAQKALAEKTERMKQEALADKKAQEALAKAKAEAEEELKKELGDKKSGKDTKKKSKSEKKKSKKKKDKDNED